MTACRWNGSPISYCENLDRIPIVLHLRGDTLGSSRLMDSITNGAIPVFSHREQYHVMPFSFLHVWSNASVLMDLAPSSNEKKIINSLRKVMHEVLQRKEELITNLKLLRHFVSWNTNHSIVFDSYLLLLFQDLGLQRSQREFLDLAISTSSEYL